MEVVGKIKAVESEAQIFGNNGFRKREVVVTTEDQYPQHILVEFAQDKCDLLNNYKVGENVKISINLRGREWVNLQGVTRYFNSIQGWRIEKSESSVQQAAGVIDEHFEPEDDMVDDLGRPLPF